MVTKSLPSETEVAFTIGAGLALVLTDKLRESPDVAVVVVVVDEDDWEVGRDMIHTGRTTCNRPRSTM